MSYPRVESSGSLEVMHEPTVCDEGTESDPAAFLLYDVPPQQVRASPPPVAAATSKLEEDKIAMPPPSWTPSKVAALPVPPVAPEVVYDTSEERYIG